MVCTVKLLESFGGEMELLFKNSSLFYSRHLLSFLRIECQGNYGKQNHGGNRVKTVLAGRWPGLERNWIPNEKKNKLIIYKN